MEKKIFNLIIVDESGSMGIIRRQALTGMNETLLTIRNMQESHPEMEQRVTLLTFTTAHNGNIRMHYDNVPASDAHELSDMQYKPHGCTPLYDAIGYGISKVAGACSKDDNVLVTIITDGEENSSREYSLHSIKALISAHKKNGWTFSFIGTENLDVEGMAESMGIDNRLSFKQDEAGTERMFAIDRLARMNFIGCCLTSKGMPEGSYFDVDDNSDEEDEDIK